MSFTPKAGDVYTRTYAYTKAPDITLTFAVGCFWRHGVLRFYPLLFPANDKSSSAGSRGEGFATRDEAFVQAAGDLSELEPVCTIRGLPQTVKRADLFGNVIDTYATEGELNGWREQQSALIGRQGGLL